LKSLTWYKDLADTRKRREYGCFLIEGRRAIEQIKLVAPDSIDEIIVVESIASEAKGFSRPIRILTDSQFGSITSSKTPQGIAAVVKIPEGSYAPELPQKSGSRIVLLEGVQDPGNVGTLVRTAAAFDFSGMVLSEECADPFSPKAVQASAGSILSIWIRRSDRYLDAARELKNRKFKVIAADIKGDQTPDKAQAGPLVLMLGSEGAGLSAGLLRLADEKVCIPMNERKAESLNVAASGAIMMFMMR
jgi:RNA methyltransferase, TrmH family